jgi:hypothetical protein
VAHGYGKIGRTIVPFAQGGAHLRDIVVEQASPSAQPDARQDSPEPCLSNRAQSAICRGVRRSTFEVGLSTGRSTSRRRTRSDCAGAR